MAKRKQSKKRPTSEAATEPPLDTPGPAATSSESEPADAETANADAPVSLDAAGGDKIAAAPAASDTPEPVDSQGGLSEDDAATVAATGEAEAWPEAEPAAVPAEGWAWPEGDSGEAAAASADDAAATAPGSDGDAVPAPEGSRLGSIIESLLF